MNRDFQISNDLRFKCHIVPQRHCLGAILLHIFKVKAVFSLFFDHLWNFYVFAVAKTSEHSISAQSCTHHNNKVLISWFWWSMNKSRVYSQNKNDKISQKPETSKFCFGINFFLLDLAKGLLQSLYSHWQSHGQKTDNAPISGILY